MRPGGFVPMPPSSNDAPPPHLADLSCLRFTQTHAQGGFPCRRCFGHAFPCEPNDLLPALQAALQEAARLDPRSPIAVLAAALTRRRWQRAGAVLELVFTFSTPRVCEGLESGGWVNGQATVPPAN